MSGGERPPGSTVTSLPNPLQRDVAALYTTHHGWLQGWLRKKVGNAFDAADLAQDTFVRLLTAPAAPVDAEAGRENSTHRRAINPPVARYTG
jgi:RNA polymerase sigma-70 factor (ECF subfamily)